MDFLEFKASQLNTINTDKQGKLDYTKFISQIPSKPLQNYAFSNIGHLMFKNNAANLGFSQLSFSNGAAYGDLDNDGDEDLVVNNINSSSFLYRNEANQLSKNHFLKVKFKGPDKNVFGIGAEVRLWNKDGIKVLQNFNTRGFQSSIEPVLLFGLGKEISIERKVSPVVSSGIHAPPNPERMNIGAIAKITA